jgi:D-3-phosphoglycerate dehydrogenase
VSSLPEVLPIVLVVDPFVDVERVQTALGREARVVDGSAAFDPADVRLIATGGVRVGQPEVDRLPGLRAVLTFSTGHDHLDLSALGAAGVGAYNTAGYCTEEVADHALACVLALWRGLPALDRDVRDGIWSSDAPGPLRRFDRSTLGIVGLGRIGQGLARRAAGLGVTVVGFDPFLPAPVAEDLGIQLCELDELLVRSDAVSLHAPGEPGAPPLIGAPELALMQPTSVLVNVARASLVDLDALARVLEAGLLAGAAFDVWETEPPGVGDRRLEAPNLLLSPHAAWYSDRAEEQLYEDAGRILRVLLDGEQPASNLALPR